MKKTVSIKALLVTVILLLMAVIPLFLTACHEVNDGTIYIKLEHKIYDCEYDERTEKITSAETPNSNRNIKVGQFYKVIFDVTFDDLKSTLQGESVDITMTVNMGRYENDLNRTKLLKSEYGAEGGLGFTEEIEGSGKWVKTFSISERDVPDFSRCYFIILLQSMGTSQTGISNNQETTVNFKNQEMTVNFKVATPKSDRKILIKGVSDSTYVVTLEKEKGDTLFTYKDNVRESDNSPNSIDISIPKTCVAITVKVFFDSSKRVSYGDEKRYEESTFSGTGTNKKLTVDLSALMIELIGIERFNLLMNEPSPSIYVVLTSDGGDNYQKVSIEFPWELRG